MKKIAIIPPGELPIPSSKGGAIETLIDYLIEENEKYDEYEFYVYSIFDKNSEQESKKYTKSKFIYIKVNSKLNKINNFFIKVIRKLSKIELETLLVKKILKDLRKRNFDKVIIEGNETQVLQISKYYNGKIYFHAHHDAFNTCKVDPNKILDRCDKVLTVSNYIKYRTRKRCSNINFNKIVNVDNCIDTEAFNKNLYKNEKEILMEKFNIKDKDIVVMFTGRTIREKGLKELIEAFKIISYRDNIKLMIVGNSGFANEVVTKYDKELIEISKDISEKIIFTGFIHNKELPKFHSLADIAVVPSMWEEPAGLVAIEALSSGLPLIITDSGGMVEYVNDGCCITVNKDDKVIENIANALEMLIENSDLRNDMASKARKQGEKYNKNKYYNDYIKSIEG